MVCLSVGALSIPPSATCAPVDPPSSPDRIMMPSTRPIMKNTTPATIGGMTHLNIPFINLSPVSVFRSLSCFLRRLRLFAYDYLLFPHPFRGQVKHHRVRIDYLTFNDPTFLLVMCVYILF